LKTRQLEVNSCKEEARRPFKNGRKFGDAGDTEYRGRKGEEGGRRGSDEEGSEKEEARAPTPQS